MLTLIAQASDLGGFTPATDAYNEGSAVGTTALSNLELFLSNLIGFLTIFASILFIVYFLIGGIEWITAGGDSGKVQKARDKMVNGVIGLVVIIGAYGVIGLIGRVIGLDLLNPAQMLESIIPGA